MALDFAGFTPEQLGRIIPELKGMQVDEQEKFLASNPAAAARVGRLHEMAKTRLSLAKGGYIKAYAPGGLEDGEEPDAEENVEVTPFTSELAGQTKDLISGTMDPTQSSVQKISTTDEQIIDTTKGQAPDAVTVEAKTVGGAQKADDVTKTDAQTYDAKTVTQGVKAETETLDAAKGTVSQEIDAAQQTESSVSGLEAAQGEAILMDNPVQRQIQDGELISGAADAAKAAKFTEQIEAATASPSKKATVAGQLEGLMQDFDDGETPPWASGAMRSALASLASRGLGASSMAGQAVIQAAMESALPIAQADAATMASFESQNLSNRQQRAMLAAKQRADFMGLEFNQAFQARVANAAKISDVANMNFTAEQQVALENSRIANSMNLANLSNAQAMVMAEAAALSNLDMANLSNRQQAAVQNAQNFLQMDLANLSNEQQTALFKAQQNIQALFNDAASQNAAAQFNASSENQTNQFFASLASQVSQFNATQANAMSQFDASAINSVRNFNASMQNQRDQFNAQNGLIVAQANAVWRQNVATLDTAAQNESNMLFAKTMNGFTATNLDAYWQRERDIMSFAFTSAENAADRVASVLLEKLSAESKADLADQMGKGTLTSSLLYNGLKWIGNKIFGTSTNTEKDE
jgi:hypothetical protein